MKIEVTQEHIDKGEPSSLFKCPVALALQQATGTRYGCDVINVVKDKGNDWNDWPPVVELPAEAQNFACAFDDEKPVTPFSFELELPNA